MWLHSWQAQDNLLSKDAQTGFGTPSVSQLVQLVGSFLGVKQPDCQPNHSLTPHAKLKKVWS
jgi:hypothetical protein